MERRVREHSPLRIGNNVYWISAAVAARHGQCGSKWRISRLGLRLLRRSESGVYAAVLTAAKAFASELEEFIQVRFSCAIGLALAGGVLGASMLSTM
jgi:hypothetical protein